jgi:hypothetical protein
MIDAFRMEYEPEDLKGDKEAKKLKRYIKSMVRKIMRGNKLIQKALVGGRD